MALACGAHAWRSGAGASRARGRGRGEGQGAGRGVRSLSLLGSVVSPSWFFLGGEVLDYLRVATPRALPTSVTALRGRSARPVCAYARLNFLRPVSWGFETGRGGDGDLGPWRLPFRSLRASPAATVLPTRSASPLSEHPPPRIRHRLRRGGRSPDHFFPSSSAPSPSHP